MQNLQARQNHRVNQILLAKAVALRAQQVIVVRQAVRKTVVPEAVVKSELNFRECVLNS